MKNALCDGDTGPLPLPVGAMTSGRPSGRGARWSLDIRFGESDILVSLSRCGSVLKYGYRGV